MTGRALNYFKNNDPEAFKGWVGMTLSQATPAGDDPVAGMSMPLIQAALGVGFNVNTFTGAPLFPQHKEKMAAERQFGPFTPEMWKQMSRQLAKIGLGISPAKMQYAFRSQTASFGAAIEKAANALLYPSSTKTSLPAIKEVPIVGEMFSRSPLVYPKMLRDLHEKLAEGRGTDQTLKDIETDIGKAETAENQFKINQLEEDYARYDKKFDSKNLEELEGFYSHIKEDYNKPIDIFKIKKIPFTVYDQREPFVLKGREVTTESERRKLLYEIYKERFEYLKGAKSYIYK